MSDRAFHLVWATAVAVVAVTAAAFAAWVYTTSAHPVASWLFVIGGGSVCIGVMVYNWRESARTRRDEQAAARRFLAELDAAQRRLDAETDGFRRAIDAMRHDERGDQ